MQACFVNKRNSVALRDVGYEGDASRKWKTRHRTVKWGSDARGCSARRHHPQYVAELCRTLQNSAELRRDAAIYWKRNRLFCSCNNVFMMLFSLLRSLRCALAINCMHCFPHHPLSSSCRSLSQCLAASESVPLRPSSVERSSERKGGPA